mgnify:CR=1 FL=1
MSILSEILKDSAYGFSLFSTDETAQLEVSVLQKEQKGQNKYFLKYFYML